MQRSAGNGPRSLGGVFFKELGRLKAVARQQQAEARAPAALPPLRPYQADVVGLVLSSWGLPLTQQLLLQPPFPGAGGAAATATAAAAATAAAGERYSRLSGGWRGNWLVCAPTGSGKTRVFVEVARWVRGREWLFCYGRR